MRNDDFPRNYEDANNLLSYVEYRIYRKPLVSTSLTPYKSIMIGECEILKMEFSCGSEKTDRLNMQKVNKAIIAARVAIVGTQIEELINKTNS